MNDAKSAPFPYIIKSKKSMYPPKVCQKAPILANYVKFADHFSIWTTGNGNLKVNRKLRKIGSICQPTQRITLN